MTIEHEIKKTLDTIKGPVLEVLNKIIDEEYMYSVDNIVDKLKIQRVYIQKEFISKMDVLKLDKTFKLYCKSCMGDLKSYRELAEELGIGLEHSDFISLNLDVIGLINRSGLNKYKLSRRILISRPQLLETIENKFMRELEYPGYDGKYHQLYYKIDLKHAALMLDVGLKDQGDLKSLYGVRTELQVYRRIRKAGSGVVAKYVIPSESDTKKGMARYLLIEDIPHSKLQLFREVFLDDNEDDNKND